MYSPKVLKIEDAVDIAHKVARQCGLDGKETDVFQLMISAVPMVEFEEKTYVRMDDMRGFLDNLRRAIANKDSSWLLQKRGLCVDRMVDIVEFIESPEYMNQKGYVRQPIMEHLVDLFDPHKYFVEAVLTGAIGIGKNYFADMSLSYMLYCLSCFHNPQLEYDLAPGSSIIFIQQSRTLTLAKKVVFEQFSERLKLSPYFTKKFPFDHQIKSELRFPKNITILPVGGSDTSALGMNVFGGIIDELNFMERVRDSQYTRYTGEDEYDQAERLYTTIIRRMKSRFHQKGKLPGKLLLVSSRNYPGDFTDRKIEEARHDRTIFVMNLSQWEALPAKHFSGEKFLVEVGNESKQSRILASRESAKDPDDVIEVPVEYKSDFERDIDAALRDLGGIATGTRKPFIPYKEQIVAAQSAFEKLNGENQLFMVGDCCFDDFFGDLAAPDWDQLVDMEYMDTILDKSQVFSAHIDVGLSGDAAGICIGRIAGYKLMPNAKVYDPRTDDFVEITDTRMPIYQVDGALRLTASPGGEVDLELVRDLILFLRGHLNLRWATLDSYQSAMLIQSFRKAGIRSGVLSMDASIAPYAEVKLAVKDERLMFPKHPTLAKELRELEKDKKKDKVDHPSGGSKDVSDALAGVVYILHRKEASYGQFGRRSRLQGPPAETQKGTRVVRIGRRIGGGTVRGRLT